MEKVDFLVIGSGPAGQKGAIQAAKLGRRVALVEKGAHVGGVTVHTGTIPSKTLREAVLYLSGWQQRRFYGRGYRLKRDVTMKDLTERLQITITHEIELIRDKLFRNGVELIEGKASFLEPNVVGITSSNGEVRKVHAEKILVCTGTRPVHPAGIPFDDPRVIDSDGILQLEDLPRSLTIVGAGVVGVEYATIFGALDVRVALVDQREKMLDFLDHEIVSTLEYLLRDRGVVLRMGDSIASLDVSGRQLVAQLKSGKQLRSDVVLFAAGRQGCTDDLGLENAGLKADDRGRLSVNDHFRTDVPHIYAAGDVIGFPSLASTSMEQGRLAACDAFSQETSSYPKHFPFGIYAVPEISMVGATEQELVKAGKPFEVGLARLRETARGQILGLDHGILKLLFCTNTRRVLGVHILGEGATELVHIGQAALLLGGTLDYFVENVFNYPTLAEAYKIAALDAWNRMPSRGAAVSGTELMRDVPPLAGAPKDSEKTSESTPDATPDPTSEERTTGASPSA